MRKDQSSGESRLARFSLDRRITITVLLATVVVVGVVAATSIPVELFPQGYTEPFLTIFTPWRDSPPREVLEKITEPLEEELSTVRGIDGVFSRSGVGRSRVWLRFKQGTDMDLAYREARDRVERARRTFPDDADKVYIFKHDSAGIPVYVMGVAVDPSVSDTYNLIQKQIVMRLERVEGVANVEINGLQEKEILIELDRDRTEASGLNIYDMAQELGSDSFTMASGHVREGDKKLLLRSVARYDDIEALRKRPVAPGVKLEDIAEVSYEEPEKRFRVRAMSMPAYALVIYKEGDANAREVCRRIDEVYAGFEAEPRLSSVLFLEIFDQGDVIDETLTTLLQSGAIGGTIAGLVLFFFLRRFRQTVVVNLAIPLSLLISLTVMYFSGLTVNIISMLALMVCVGLLVDNSVVVAENIDRMYRAGASRRRAAVRGASEIGVAITLSTLTTVVVFLPVALVEGPAQFFLLRMAVPISVALLASLVVALVCIPLGVYLTLPKDRERSPEAVEHPRPSVGRVFEMSYSGRRYWPWNWKPWRPYLILLQEYRSAENGQRPPGWPKSILWVSYELSFGLMNQVYNRVLARALSQRLEMVIILLLIFVATMGAMKARDLRFVEVQENESRGFEIDVEMPSSFTLEETEDWFLAAEKIVEDNAEELGLEGWFLWHMKTFGELEGWFSTPNTSGLTGREVTERVVEMLPKRPGIVFHTGEESQVDEGDAETTYQLRINGEDIEMLDQVAGQLEELFVMVPGVLGVKRGDEQEPNELALVVDRERVQKYGINPMVVAGLVGYALRGQALPEYREEGREVPVRVRYQEKDREDLASLESFQVPTQSGGLLPISAVTSVQMLDTPSSIYRRDKRMSRSITLDLKEGQEEATREQLRGILVRINLPEGITFSDQIAAEELDEDLAALQFALMISILFIYLLMGLLFESFILPLSIIFTIPLASLGVILAHLVAGMNIDFLGAVGIVLLVGVVVNNGIVLIDYVNRLRAEGIARREAILLAADRRFRPIMMTAITTIGGMVPLALAGRMDSGISYTSFALTLIGGMSTATLLTLLVVPVFYTLFDDLRDVVQAAYQRTMGRGGAEKSVDLGTSARSTDPEGTQAG